MATTKKPAAKTAGTRKLSSASTTHVQRKKASAAVTSYDMHIQLEVMLVSLLSIIFLILAIVQYS